ncbi:hypothetical protein XENTR_v10012196 [Xenopus tropicalis]|nr:hypothetical protein XENTR_v10012196 [Xenopus tropicalis]
MWWTQLSAATILLEYSPKNKMMDECHSARFLLLFASTSLQEHTCRDNRTTGDEHIKTHLKQLPSPTGVSTPPHLNCPRKYSTAPTVPHDNRQ